MVKRKNQPKLPLDIRIKKRVNILIEKKGLIFSVFLIGIFLAAVISFLLPKSYRASAKIFFKYNTVNNQYLANNGILNNEIAFLKSNELANYITTQLAKKGIAVSANDIQKFGEILIDDGGAILSYSFISDEANKAAQIGNAIINNLYEKCLIYGRTPLISGLKSVDDREKLLKADVKRLVSSSLSSEISSLSPAEEDLLNQIAELESELESIDLDYKFYSEILKKHESLIENKYDSFVENILVIEDITLNELQLKLDRLEAMLIISNVSRKFENLSISYPWNDTYDLNTINETREELHSGISMLISESAKNNKIDNIDFFDDLVKNVLVTRSRLNGIDIAKTIIFNTMNSLEGKFNLIPFELIDEARQSRAKKFNNALSLKLKSKIDQLNNKETKYFAEVDSITEAIAPRSYFSPNTTLNIFLGGISGLIIGLLLASFSSSSKIEFIKNTVDIEDAGYNVVSNIPSFPEKSPILFDELKHSEKQKLDPKILESFQNIETFLKYGNLENPLKTILITSQHVGEGKSVIASNIALALANTNNKVLLVDANLKQPQLHKLFKVKSTPSIAHYLFRKKELEEIVRKTHNRNLDLITCIEFPQNPSVIVTSERMKNFMTQVEEKYDYIIYDSCSLDLLRETASIAENTDRVMLVVRSNKTKISSIIEAENLLDEFGVSEFNVVLNDVKT